MNYIVTTESSQMFFVTSWKDYHHSDKETGFEFKEIKDKFENHLCEYAIKRHKWCILRSKYLTSGRGGHTFLWWHWTIKPGIVLKPDRDTVLSRRVELCDLELFLCTTGHVRHEHLWLVIWHENLVLPDVITAPSALQGVLKTYWECTDVRNKRCTIRNKTIAFINENIYVDIIFQTSYEY